MTGEVDIHNWRDTPEWYQSQTDSQKNVSQSKSPGAAERIIQTEKNN